MIRFPGKMESTKALTINGQFFVKACWFLIGILGLIDTFAVKMFEKAPDLSLKIFVCTVLAGAMAWLAQANAFEAFAKKSRPLQGIGKVVQRWWPGIQTVVDVCGRITCVNLFGMSCLYTGLVLAAMFTSGTHLR